MVLCYGAVFFLVVPFVAFILLPNTAYFELILGCSGTHFGTCCFIFVASGSSGDTRGTPCSQKLIFDGFREAFDKILEKSSSRSVVL